MDFTYFPNDRDTEMRLAEKERLERFSILEQMLGGPNANTSMAITRLKENPRELDLIEHAFAQILRAREIQNRVDREIQSQKPPLSPLPLARGFHSRNNVKQEGISPEQLYQDLSHRHSNALARQGYYPTPTEEYAIQKPDIEQIMSLLSRQR